MNQARKMQILESIVTREKETKETKQANNSKNPGN